MMKKYISAALIALAAVTSCIESPSDLAIKDGGNALKVRFSTPELEVKSGNDTPDFYAYIPTELAAGNVSPIGYTDLNSEGYYLYNLPEGTTEVVFSNISNSTEVVIGKDESQNTTFSIADETPLMDEDILYGMVSGMNDKSSTYSVDIKRLTAKLSHYFYMVDADGNPLATDKIANIGISYTNIGKSLSINSEGEMAVGHYDGGISYGYSDMADEDGHVFTKSIIPSTLIPTMRVTIQFKDGTDKVYTQELTKAFEANHHYRVTLRLKKMNGDFNFTLYEPEVEVNSESPHIYTKEFFNITGSRIVGGKAEDETTLEVSTILPYEWTYTVTEGEDYFDIEVIDNKIIVSAKSDNDNEARSATILLNTNEGYSEVITVYQKTSKPHRIVLTSQHTNTYSSFNISGENITVKDPNDLEAVVYEGSIENRTIQIDGLSTGSTVVIEGDIITNFRLGGSDSSSKTDEYGYIYESYSENYGYYLSSYSRKSFTYSFENCAYLEDLAIQGADVSFDVSGMPNLRRLYIAHNPNLTEVIFGEKQKIEHLYIQYCDAIAGIDLSKIASTLKTANFYDSDKLSGVQFVDCANLKYLNVNGCGGIKIINLTGCTSLEDLYIYSVSPTNLNLTNCTSLKNLRLNSVTLDKLVTTGADNIENITTENTVSITNLNLAGKSKLSTLGAVYNVATFDISDTPKLSEVTVSFNSSSEQKLNLSGTNLTSVTFYNFNTNIDYSNLASCKKIYLPTCYTEITGMDLSACSVLEDFYIHMSSTSSSSMKNLVLPKSLKKLNLSYLRYLDGELDLSNMKSLEELDLYYLDQITGIDLSGCTSLKSLNKDDSDNSNDGQNSTYTRCTAVENVNLTDCSSLEYFRLTYGKLTSLDFSASKSLTNIDIRSNKLEEAALIDMFNSLPDRSTSYQNGIYNISGNPGVTDAVKELAESRGWF